MIRTLAPLRTLTRRLHRDRSGVAMIEFAWTMPVVLSIGCYGIELSNLALLNMRVSQIALTLADNASRVGTTTSLATQQLREVDVNDVLQGVRAQADNIELTTRGRVILSSLENVQQTYDTAPVQRIHWQRCIGLKSGTGYDPITDETAPTNAGSDETSANAGKLQPTGMGDAGSKVSPPPGSGVMYVEVNYETKPLFGTMLISPKRLHYVASFIVRDRRDFSKIWNLAPPNATTPSKCNLYTKGPGGVNT